MKKYIVFYIILLFFSIPSFSQSIIGLPFITKYYPVDYHAQGQNFDIAQDSLGRMYFGNTNGILRFDGKNWTLIKLPNDEFPRCIYITHSGTMYIGGAGFIYKVKNLNTDKFEYISLIDRIPEEYRDFYTIWKMVANDSLIFFSTGTKVYKIDNDTTQIYNLDSYIFNIDLHKNKLYVSLKGYFAIIDDKMTKISTGEYTPLSFYFMDDTTFYFNNHLEIKSFINNRSYTKNKLKINIDKRPFYIDKFLPYGTDKYILVSLNDGIFILDKDFNEIQHLCSKTGLTSDIVYSVYIDKLNNLWVAGDNGVSYVEMNTPFTVVDSRMGLSITSPVPLGFFNKKLYLFDGNYVNSIEFDDKIKIYKIKNLTRQCWDGIPIDNKIFISHNPGIVMLDKRDSIKIYGPTNNVWRIYPFYDSSSYLLTSTEGLLVYKYYQDSLKFVKKMKGIESVREIIRDKEGYYWISESEGALRIKFDSNFNIVYKKKYGPQQGLIYNTSIDFYNWKNKLLISTGKTVYEYNFEKDTIIPFYDLLGNADLSGNNYLNIIAIDKKNDIWVDYDDGANHNYYALEYKKDKFVAKYPFMRRLQKGLIAGIVDYKKYYFIFSNDGFFIFDTTKQNLLENIKYNTIITKIILISEDSILYKNTNVVKQLKYHFNSIRFEYAAPYYIMPSKILYRYRLLNYKNKWSSWSYDTYTSYTNLPPGTYEFEVEAKNIFGQVSKSVVFDFKILPPWYRTVYAYIGYFILTFLLFYLAVKFFTYNLKRKNEKLEQTVKERTKEILMKNTELEQQKEEIMMQAEELALVNQELEKLSVVVRETGNAVIITDPEGNFVWINSAFTKMFGYTFEELVNNISKNIISESTDPEIKKIVKKCIEEKVTVKYELKVRNKYNKEIWVQTTLTPILKNNQIESLVAIDSDITPLKKAEKKIREQKEQITASIRYARTIQESILPSKKSLDKLFDVGIIYYPKDIVSGDFYWVSNIFVKDSNYKNRYVLEDFDNNELDYTFYFVVADCTGHGVPGAFMSLIGYNLLRSVINELKIEQPKDILEKLDKELNALLHRKNEENMDGMVMSLLRFDVHNQDYKKFTKITFAGAKQDIIFYNHLTNEFLKIKSVAREIGFSLNNSIKFVQKEFVAQKDDLIFAYTDGLKDLSSPLRKSFGSNRIMKILKSTEPDTEQITRKIKQEIADWSQGTNQRDDITFVSIKIR